MTGAFNLLLELRPLFLLSYTIYVDNKIIFKILLLEKIQKII